MGKNNKDGIVIILVLFIIVGLAWDPARKEMRSNSTSNEVFGDSSVGNNESESGQGITEEEVLSQIKESEQTVNQIQKDIEKQNLEKTRSIYYGKVTISRPAYLNDPDPSREYMTLSTSLDRGEKVDITGWVLKSDRSGNSATIGKASLLPFPYKKGEDNVILHQGDRIYLIKGFSPIGTSFRTNKCTGYFGQYNEFFPYIARNCPLPRDEDLPQFSNVLDRDDECKDLIERLPRCSVPTNTNRLPDTVSSSCKTYLQTKINYNVCVSEHKGDTDFPGNEWYVYLNRFGPLWRDKRETIKLLDRVGKVVSETTYNY